MRRLAWLALAFLLAACQPQQQPAPPSAFVDGGDLLWVRPVVDATAPELAARAGMAFSPEDGFRVNGYVVPADYRLPAGGSYTIQVQRAISVSLRLGEEQKNVRSTARTVADLLAEQGLTLFVSDYISPPPSTPLTDGLVITYRPARAYTIRVDGVDVAVKASAQTVGQVLVSAGIPLLGLDYSLPGELESPPPDGQIRVVRVSESVLTEQNPIPYTVRYEYSTDLPIDSQTILKVGVPGLAMSRVRVRYEDGAEVARVTEAEALVRPPVEQVVGRGTKVEIKTLEVPGGQVQYWQAVSMYATSYSPCRLGVPGLCSTGTASGLSLRRGVVAMSRAWYNAYVGTQVYIPGYGVAVVGDVGGGFPDGRAWIDLGYGDDDWQNWSGWVTVYFLAPAPASVPAFP